MKDGEKVVRLADFKAQECGSTSVKELLKTALEELEKEEEAPYNKAVLLFLNDTGGEYTTGYAASGVKRHQVIALLEIMKQRFINDLLRGEAT